MGNNMEINNSDTGKNIFFESQDFALDKVQKITSDLLHDMHLGEIFMEYKESESLIFDDGILRASNYDISKGFGLRSVIDDVSAYSYSSNFSIDALKEAAITASSIKNVKRDILPQNISSGSVASPISATSSDSAVDDLASNPSKHRLYKPLYSDTNPVTTLPFAKKVELLKEIDAYLRAKDEKVIQVSASLFNEWQLVNILTKEGRLLEDIRPLTRLNISVIVESNGRRENGSYGLGGRAGVAEYITEESWKHAADDALRQALVNLESVPAKGGQMPVVLGAGWPGVLLHEAVGHGLEGDFNRKKTSVFSSLMGQRIATKGVTVVDDGTIKNRRGSISIDDEGELPSYNVLIEDGILKNYMQDKMNARLMGVSTTGNGRRETYAHQPMPRMTNTYMLGGNHTKQEMIETVKNGIYAASFGGGQVDITSGKFVFSATEAYKIENGKITAPIKGATLIGDGAEVLKKIKMIGNDMALDTGVGTCGKDGQSVPVGVGQPSLLIGNINVGGTEV